MKTIQQLKLFVREELELPDDYVREFGPLTQKATWQKAIDNYQQAIATQKITDFVPPTPVPPLPLPEPEEKPEEDEPAPDPQTLNLNSLVIIEYDEDETFEICELENIDSFQEFYKDWSIYLSIPNGGILGGTIVNPRKSYALRFSTQDLSLYYAYDWHLQVARRYVDKVMTDDFKDYIVDCNGVAWVPNPVVAIASLEKMPVKATVKVIGRLIRCKTIVTKKGDDMAFFEIEDKTGLVDVTVFPKVYSKFHHLLKPNSLLSIAAQIEKRSDDSIRLLADEIEPRFVQMLGRAAEAPMIDNSIAPAIYQRFPSNYYSDDYCLPDNLIGAPRLIAKYLSDNFNWQLEKDNSHLKSPLIEHYANPDVIEGVKIVYTSGLLSVSDKIKKYSAIVLFSISDACHFSRLFTWESSSSFNPNANLKQIARQYLRDTIKTFAANSTLNDKVGRSCQN